MSKSRKSLAIIAGAVVPVLYGAGAMAQLQPITYNGNTEPNPFQYPDGNPPALPSVWPSSIQNATTGASATGTDPVITSNEYGGNVNISNVNGAPNNGGSSQATVNEIIGPGSGMVILAQTFMPTSNFKLGGISFFMTGGGEGSFDVADGASIHLYQLAPGINGSSSSYNLTAAGTSGDLLGGGAGDNYTPTGVNNIEQFVFTGSDQVTLQAGSEYAIELFDDVAATGDTIGLARTSGSDNDPSPQPYVNGALFAVQSGQAGASDEYYDPQQTTPEATPNGTATDLTVSRIATAFTGATSGFIRESLFAVYAAPPTVTAGTWIGTAGDSNWGTANNWVSNDVPGTTPGDSALFAGANNSATTQLVNLNGNQTLGSITFNNQGSLYTIAQGSSGTLTLQNSTGTAHIDDLIGDPQAGGQLGHTISAPISIAAGGVQIAVGSAADTLVLSGPISGAGGVTLMEDSQSQMVGTVVMSGANTYAGGTTVASGRLLIKPTGPTTSALPKGALSISGGTVQLADNVTAGTPLGTSNVNLTSLSITGNGTFDIGNNRIIIDYSSPATDPIASIASWINNGFYDLAGPQIISSDIAADDAASGLSYGIGYADGADGVVAGLPSGEIEVMLTLLGDANLDGTVNTEDFTQFSTNLGQSGKSWDDGDFNYDGTVNTEDFTLFSHNLGESDSLAAAAGTLQTVDGLSLANVPEPMSAGMMVMAGLGILRRRRKPSPKNA